MHGAALKVGRRASAVGSCLLADCLPAPTTAVWASGSARTTCSSGQTEESGCRCVGVLRSGVDPWKAASTGLLKHPAREVLRQAIGILWRQVQANSLR